MKQEFIVEKDPTPMLASKPWRVRCTAGDGPFKPHIADVFSKKKNAVKYAKVYNDFIQQN